LVGDATGKYPRNELDGLLASPHAHLYKPAIAWLQKERPDLIAPVAHADVM
jgi:hypothetical protein